MTATATRNRTTRRDVYAEVTDRIVAQLEAGTVPWHRPWDVADGYPHNANSGRPYRGINVFLLAMTGYADPRWATYRGWQRIGAQVRRSTPEAPNHGTRVILWKPVRKRTENQETHEEENHDYLLLRDYVVFNAQQVDDAPEREQQPEREFTPIEAAQQILDGYVLVPGSANPGPPLLHGYAHAAYSPTSDRIEMPDPEAFESNEAYYLTGFHEATHSTGHETRLKRIEPALFGSDPYAREELVAEMGASMLAGVAGLSTAGGDNSAAYIAGWLKALANDHKLVVKAAAQAQKAADMILGTTFDKTFDDDTEAAPAASEEVK